VLRSGWCLDGGLRTKINKPTDQTRMRIKAEERGERGKNGEIYLEF
jgi:hypothetical protein